MEAWQEQFAEAIFKRAADTAHDLKTPLNIAVLNLELLRMRVRKVSGEDDEKIRDYTKAVEFELRRLAQVFDAFFVNVVPPPDDGPPQALDAAPLLVEAAERFGFTVRFPTPISLQAHQPRIRTLASLFFEGASRLLGRSSFTAEADHSGRYHRIDLRGPALDPEVELGKLFKFYYTDGSGAADLSLATCRLIAETYGGSLSAEREADRIRLELLLPQGER